MAAYACQLCGKPGGVTELVTLSGWQGIDNLRWEEDHSGKERLRFTTTTEREASWDSTDGDGFHCAHCDNVRPRLEELVTLKPLYECRTCGWIGVDVGEHPDAEHENCADSPELIEALPPLEGQEKLDIAA